MAKSLALFFVHDQEIFVTRGGDIGKALAIWAKAEVRNVGALVGESANKVVSFPFFAIHHHELFVAQSGDVSQTLAIGTESRAPSIIVDFAFFAIDDHTGLFF